MIRAALLSEHKLRMLDQASRRHAKSGALWCNTKMYLKFGANYLTFTNLPTRIRLAGADTNRDLESGYSA